MIVYIEREEVGGITEASRFASSLQVLELVDTLSVYIFEGNYALVSAFHISPPILYTNRQASEHGAILICSWTSGLRLFSSYFWILCSATCGLLHSFNLVLWSFLCTTTIRWHRG
jgi:hypothetical protein